MGTAWPASGLIERDNNDERATGALAYFFVGGTTTPLTVYEDSGENTAHEHPLEADANGRWPIVFIPFTDSYDVKVTTSDGTQLYYHVEIPNPAPTEANPSPTVDDTQLLQTGDVIFSPKSGTRDGFVRLNGRTIGSAISGATERAHDDVEDLYLFLWNNFADGQCPVITGRGGSAAVDWAANKVITIFDMRAGGPLGLDDMGNTAAGVLTATPVGNGSATTPGSFLGAASHTLTEAQLPIITPNGTVNDTRTFRVKVSNTGVGASTVNVTPASSDTTDQTPPISITTNDGITFAGNQFGGGTSHNNTQRSILGNWLMKL